MIPTRRRRFVILIAVGAIGLAVAGASSAGRALPPAPVTVSVNRAVVVGSIPPALLSLSIEYWAFEYSAGKNPRSVDPVFVQLLRNLDQGRHIILRIGGGSTDTTWWPVPGFKRPGGVNYPLTKNRLAVMKAVANAVGVRLMLGLNFAAGSPTLAAAEGRAIVSTIGARRIDALEIGNEPELYGNPAFPWYYMYHGKPVSKCPSKAGCQPVAARQSPYDLPAFIRDFARFGAKLPRVPLAGPASNGGTWLGNNLSQFISAEPRLGVVTMHRYPFQACFVSPGSPHYPTIARMLSPEASIGQAQGAAPFAAAAHAHHLPYAIDEINTISCGDPPGLANSFAMALWALDTLFAHAQAGVDSLNIHTWPGAIYRLFTFCDWPKTPIHCRTFKHPLPGWQATVEPEYYGLLMFSRAAPRGSLLLKTSSGNPAVRAWATRAPDGTVRIVLINGDPTSSHVISVRVSGPPVPATLERLLAPSASATGGVTLAGQSFAAQTHSGLLTGPVTNPVISPTGGAYSVSLPAASAAMLALG